MRVAGVLARRALAYDGSRAVRPADDEHACALFLNLYHQSRHSRFCEQCGTPLKGRQRRYCSERCRARVRRKTDRGQPSSPPAANSP
jgi:hypothetical protein